MSFRVIWRERVVDGLWQLKFLAYEMGQDADAISLSVSEIAHRLALNPSAEGESRSGNERVLIVEPLSVIYEVFEAVEAVFVYNATVYPRRSV
jgi:hypothetical protein